MNHLIAEQVYTHRIWDHLAKLAEESGELEINDFMAQIIQLAGIDALASGRDEYVASTTNGYQSLLRMSLSVIRANVGALAPGTNSEELYKYIQETALLAESSGYQRGIAEGRKLFNSQRYAFASDVRRLLLDDKRHEIVPLAKNWVVKIYAEHYAQGQTQASPLSKAA